MDKKKLYEQILSLAKELEKDNSKFTRADLAYELKELGFLNDSLDVSRIVMEAYNYFGNIDSIKNAFLNNEGSRSIIEEFAISELMDSGEHYQAFEQVSMELDNANASLKQLAKISPKSLIDDKENNKFNFSSWLQGSIGVENVKEAAKTYFEKYSLLVSGYKSAKDDVKVAITEFVDIRNYVANVYQRYAIKLIDVFGEAIKSVAPTLFDFDKVEYLNVDEMHKAVKLKYDILAERCATLIQDINANFFQSLNQSVKAIGSSDRGNNTAKLIFAVANMYEHYSYASEQGIIAKKELEEFKQDIKHDVTLIAGDYARLASIYKILNDLYIPKAEVFYRYSEEVFTQELEQLFSTLYEDEKIKDIVSMRDNLLDKLRKIEQNIVDHKFNIEYYTSSITNGQELLKHKQSDYDIAISSNPKRPSFFYNLLTFGKAIKKYNMQAYEWQKYMKPLIIEYDNYQAELKLDSDELKKHQQNLNNLNKELHKSKIELKRLNEQIINNIKVADETKLLISRNLESIVKLLHVAKEIVESKLDEKHIKTLKITDSRNIQLPESTIKKLDSFTDSLKNSLEIPEDEENSQEDEILLAQSNNKIVDRSLKMLKELSKLRVLQQQGEMVRAQYDKAFENIRTQFENQMKDIDDKSSLLLETIKRINTSTNKDELRESLLSLGKNSNIISMSDLEEFLSGNKQIEI